MCQSVNIVFNALILCGGLAASKTECLTDMRQRRWWSGVKGVATVAMRWSSLFLGLELSTDQLRATIVDENLELVGVEAVDLIPLFRNTTVLTRSRTQGGIFTTPGDAYTTPVDMWVKALDFLLEEISRNHEVSRIKSIGGAAQPALVWWKSTPVPSFPSLDSRLPLHSQLSPNTFSLPNTPVAQDTFSHSHALSIEAMLGGPDHMAARVGTCANSSLIAAQILRVHETSPETWARTGRVQIASAFLASLISGTWINIGETEACATGMYVYASGVIEYIAGSREEAWRVRGWLGDVDVSGGGRRVATVSRYLVDRYGFEPDTTIASFTADYLATYLSLVPSPSDAILSFGPMDFLLTSAPHYLPNRLYSVFPHPAQDPSEKRKYISMLTSRNADVPRALVRDMYTKSWSAFDRLVSVVPPGGSIGLDDKLFSFWLLQGDSHPMSHVKGIFRFETGVKVNEFRDLRANPRCLVESQILSFRVRWARMTSTGALGATVGRARGNSSLVTSSAAPSPGPGQRTGTPAIGQLGTPLSGLGLSFDPYDSSSCDQFPAVASLVSELFNAPLDSAQITPHRNAPAKGYPGRAALGGAYVARWVWGKERGTGRGSFEEEVRRLLAKRWVASGGSPVRTHIGGETPAGSGANTPYSTRRTGFGAAVLEEEEEDALEEMERLGGDAFGEGELAARLRSATGSSTATTAPGASAGSSNALPSTAFTTPDVGTAANTGPASEVTATGSTAALMPVTALPTSESETQVGLAKVAEPDVDAFMAYAAIVPEYCRLEGMW
ncbi:hypothetical protein BJV77DRAFT_991732 [Russula vinacea]|nr:hypothetical protein BJV77DRAFT_991732 [Russula vinacea]